MTWDTTEKITDSFKTSLFRGLEDDLPYHSRNPKTLRKVWNRIINKLDGPKSVKEELKNHMKLWRFREVGETHGTITIAYVEIIGVTDVEVIQRLKGYRPWIEWGACCRHSTPVTIEWERES